MKKKFTIVWSIFGGMLTLALFTASTGRFTENNSTTVRKDITSTTPGGDGCSGTGCHSAATGGGRPTPVLRGFPTNIVPGQTYEITMETSFDDAMGNITSIDELFPAMQLAVYSRNTAFDLGEFQEIKDQPYTVGNSLYKELDKILLFLVRGDQGNLKFSRTVKWTAASNLPDGLEITGKVGSMYKLGDKKVVACPVANTTNAQLNDDEVCASNTWGCANLDSIVGRVTVITTNCTTQPDITLANPISLPSIPAGSTTWFEVDVKNNGIASTKSYSLGCYLSTDNQLSSSDQFIGEFGQPDLPNTGRNRIEGAFRIQHGNPAGAYFLIFSADKNNQIVECNESNNTLAVPITITAGNGFCASKSLYNTNEYIKSVKIGSIEANTIADNYSEKLYLDRHFKKGTAQPVTITGGFSGPFTASEYCRIWADINQDNQFTDNEIVFSKKLTKPAIAGSSTKSISGSLTIPLAAKSGYTRLRVSMQRGAWPPACGNLTLGEVEDYVVNVVDELKPGDRQSEDIFIEKSPEIALAPNPATDGSTLDLSAFFGKNVDVAVFDLNGKLAFQQNIEASANPYLSIQTGDWQPGVYTVFVRAEGFRPVAKKLAVVRM